MKYQVVNIEDVRWLLGHTGGFRGGYVTDVQVSKRRLLDEASGREVLAGTTVTVVIRYRIRQMARVAKLTMTGVTDFSMFEQEGADCSTLGVIQAELTDGKLRFWFDPQGELYVVCEEAQLEEVAAPSLEPLSLEQVAQWTFQSEMPDWPTVTWLLAELDVAGVPCTWRATASPPGGTLPFSGKGICFRRRCREQWMPQGFTVCCMGRSMGRGSAWCCGSVGCRIAAPVRCFRSWRT